MRSAIDKASFPIQGIPKGLLPKKQVRADAHAFRRLWDLINNYARPFMGWIIAITVLNLVAFFVSIMSIGATAGTIKLFTIADVEKLTSSEKLFSFEDLTLGRLGEIPLRLIDTTSDESRFIPMLILALIGLGLVTLRELLTLTSQWLALKTSEHMRHTISMDVLSHYMRFSLSFFNQEKRGRLISRMRTDTLQATSGLHTVIRAAFQSPLLMAFFIILTFQSSPLLFLALLLSVGFHHGLSVTLTKPLQSGMRKLLDIFAEYNATLHEVLGSIRLVKSFATEEHEYDRLDKEGREAMKAQIKLGVLKNAEKHSRSFINAATQAIILILVAFEFARGNLSADACLLFIFVAQTVAQPVTDLSNAYVSSHVMAAASERIWKFFERRSDVPDGTRSINGFSSSIVVEDLHFSYGEGPTLNGIHLELAKGRKVALVGPSGGGKSTFTDMILRFYDPDAGRILIDGVDIRELKLADYRRLFGIVSQEPILIHASIRENILYGRSNIGDAALEKAAQLANADVFIQQMPNGFNTIVGDRGVRLSGGQAQRIALARALVSDPPILILDEATSSLDSQSENEVQQAIERATERSTAIIVAHRLSTVLHADEIFVLEKGRIVARGRHQELINSCDLYRRLCDLQFTPLSEMT